MEENKIATKIDSEAPVYIVTSNPGIEDRVNKALHAYYMTNTPNGSKKVNEVEINAVDFEGTFEEINIPVLEKFTVEQPNLIDHPAHYTAYGKESIELMEQYFGKTSVQAFCMCSCWKYLYRHNLKGNSLQDIRKLLWYAERYVSYEPSLAEDNGRVDKHLKKDVHDYMNAHSERDTLHYILDRCHDFLKNRNMVGAMFAAKLYISLHEVFNGKEA